MRYISTHHTGIRCNGYDLRNTTLFKNTIVCMVTYIIVFLQIFLRCVERISILHSKLTYANHSGTRSCLITKLSLELIDHKRILCISLRIFANQMNSCLLMCHTEDMLCIVAVRKTKKLTSYALISSGLLPQISRKNNRE